MKTCLPFFFRVLFKTVPVYCFSLLEELKPAHDQKGLHMSI